MISIISCYYFRILFVFLGIGIISGCSYSFTGASVPEHIKTIAIPIVKDRSGSGQPELSDLFTNGLIQDFIDDNTLQIAEKVDADAVLECTIISLSDAPSLISSGESVTTRRITVTAQVTYKDLVMRKTIFSKNFSNYADYQSSGDIVTLRKEAIESSVDKIVEDILLAVVSNW